MSIKPGEAQSYGDELAEQAHIAWDWTKNTLRQTGNHIASLGMWLLVVGGIVLGAKAFGRGKQRQSASMRRALNRRLTRLAERDGGNA